MAFDTLSAVDVQHREIGSKLVLASRIFYAAFIWTAKLTVLEFLKRTVGAYWRKSYEIGLQVIRYFLLATFVAVIVATLAECQPFDHYWQVTPDPGPRCREGVAQLLTMGICDIITDVLLVVFPAPIVMMSTLPVKRKISLVLLFALSLALVAVTAYRIPSTIRRGDAQQYRSLLASLEILAAAAVSNSIVIGSFIRDKGVKKAKYRRESTGGSSSLERTMTKRTTITQNHWGSDSDLVGDVGMYLAPDLQSRKSSTISTMAKPVPPPQDYALAKKGEHAGPSVEDDVSSISTNSTHLKHELGNVERSAGAVSPPVTPKKMSFFDVGNLMQSTEKASSAQSSNTAIDSSQRSSFKDFAKAPALPQPQAQRQPQWEQHPSSPENTASSLADVGGLLSATRSSTDADRSTALPLAARQRPPSDHQQPLPSSPPLSPRNFSRRGYAYSQPGRSNSSTTQQEPPSYRPRRVSETTQWNRASVARSMEIVDAGGLLK